MDKTTSEEDPPPTTPLTHSQRDGSPMIRPIEIERQIAAVIALNPSEISLLVANYDKDSPDYVKEETLVYLIREFHRFGEEDLVNRLVEVLEKRCKDRITSQLRLVSEDAYRDVVFELLERILDVDSDRGDFLQVRFWKGLKFIIIDISRKYIKEVKLAQQLMSLSELTGEDTDDEIDDSSKTILTPLDREIEPRRIEKTVVGIDGLEAINNPKHRWAYVLHYKYDWNIESQDPDIPTLSKKFGKDPRTIHNWLTKAETDIQLWRMRGDYEQPNQ